MDRLGIVTASLNGTATSKTVHVTTDADETASASLYETLIKSGEEHFWNIIITMLYDKKPMVKLNKAMMGLQATATKRKYEIGACGNAGEVQPNCTPAKASRWSTISNLSTTNRTKTTHLPSAEDSIAKLEAVAAATGEPWGAEPIVDSISRLQAVAVPDTWGSDSSRSALATTLLSADELDEDDDDFEDDFDEEESIIPSYSPLRYPCTPPPRGYIPPGYPKPNYYSEPYPQQNCSRTPSQYTRPTINGSGGGHYGWNSHGYYIPPEAASPQQTIRCAENGKSYLELGSGSYGSIDPRQAKRCCDGRSNWCNSKQCYRDRRLKMRNLSMFKLSRFRQVSEQSLYRSVLICNTLKCIDREMEQESKESTNPAEFHATHYNNNNTNNNNNNSNNSSSNNNSNNTRLVSNSNNSAQQELQQSPPNQQYSSSDNSNSNFTQPYNNRISATTIMSFNESLPPYDHHPLRDTQSGRATPFPSIGATPDTDSGYGDEDCTRPINWGSVLSLSSQSALDPLNNNDLFATTTSSAATFVSTISSTASTSSTITTINTTSPMNISPTTNWEYNLLDMDLGLGPELTELLPSWKLTPLSADDILKSVPPPMEPSKVLMDNEMDNLTHIMVGS